MWVVKGILNDEWLTDDNYAEILDAFKPLINEDVALDIDTYMQDSNADAKVVGILQSVLGEIINSFMQTRCLIKKGWHTEFAGLRMQDAYTYFKSNRLPSGTVVWDKDSKNTDAMSKLRQLLSQGDIRLTAKVAATADEYRNYVSVIAEKANDPDGTAVNYIKSNSARIYSRNAKPRSNPMSIIGYAYNDLSWLLKAFEYLTIIYGDNNIDAKGVLYNFACT